MAAAHYSDGWPYPAADGRAAPADQPVKITAVPYFAWANRGIGPMRVWLPRLSS